MSSWQKVGGALEVRRSSVTGRDSLASRLICQLCIRQCPNSVVAQSALLSTFRNKLYPSAPGFSYTWISFLGWFWFHLRLESQSRSDSWTSEKGGNIFSCSRFKPASTAYFPARPDLVDMKPQLPLFCSTLSISVYY